MVVTRKKINSRKIDVIKNDTIPTGKIKGADLFDILYNNIFICARKHSGKTVLIWNIIKETVDRNTKVIVFSGTHYNDSNYQHIKDYLNYKKIDSVFYDSIFEGKMNVLEEIIQEIKAEDIPDDEIEETEEMKKTREEIQKEKDVNRILGIKEEKPKKPKKPKKLTPKYLFVFDDISSELKSKAIDSLLKQNRHYKARVIISTQWLNDLLPSSRRQLQTYILFGGHSITKMESLYENADLGISFEQLMTLYKEATAERFNFLYINTDTNDFRKNFDERFEIDEE